MNPSYDLGRRSSDKQDQSGWVSVLSSKSSKETLEETEYTDIKYVIQEEPTTIILPVDSSSHAENCLQFYIRYIHKIGNKVFVLYVSEDYVKMHSHKDGDGDEKDAKSCCSRKKSGSGSLVVRKVGASPGILKELEQEDKKKCHQFKKKVKTWFRTNGVLFEFHRLVSNDVPKTIVQFANQKNGKMIVMGARNLSGFKSTFMTSVSNKVSSLAEIPVLIVKASVGHRSSQTAIN